MAETAELKKQILLENIPDALLESLTGVVKELSLKEGDVLYSENDEAKGIYMIRSGKIEVSKATEDGWKQRLAVFNAGHFFGELSIMVHRKHEAEARAIENSSLYLLTKEDFERIENENHELALGIIKQIAIVISNNLRDMNRRFVKALINY
jgi:CRP/FNR family cyclic AMP-dependent transcriptional regulator